MCDADNAVGDPAPYSGQLADFLKTKDSSSKSGVPTVTVKVAPGYAKYEFGMLRADRTCGNGFWANLQPGRAYEMAVKWIYEGSWPLTKQLCSVAITDL